MFSETRPWMSADRVLSCWTKIVGAKSPDRYARRNLSRVVTWPSTTPSSIGSGLDLPKSVSTESIPHSSARRQKCVCVVRSGWPSSMEACWSQLDVIPGSSRLYGSLQWNLSGFGSMSALERHRRRRLPFALPHPRQDLAAEVGHLLQVGPAD